MVGRFVQYQEVHGFQQEFDHCEAGTLSTGQHFHFLIRSFTAEHKGTEDITYLRADIAYGYAVDGIKYSQAFIQELCLVLSEVTDLYIMTEGELTGIVGDFSHDTLYQGGFTFTVLTYERHFLTTVYGQVDIVEDDMVAIGLPDILTDDRVTSATAAASKLQTQCRVVFLVYLDAFYLFQLFDAALHLHGFRGFIAEALDKGFRIFYLFLLILIGTELLFTTFLPQYDKFVILHFVVVNLSASNFNGTCGDIIEKCTVVTHQYHGIGTCGKEIFKPLDTLNIQVVGRFVEQQHIGTAKQEFGKLDTHTPTTGKLTGGAVEVFAAKT